MNNGIINSVVEKINKVTPLLSGILEEWVFPGKSIVKKIITSRPWSYKNKFNIFDKKFSEMNNTVCYILKTVELKLYFS